MGKRDAKSPATKGSFFAMTSIALFVSGFGIAYVGMKPSSKEINFPIFPLIYLVLILSGFVIAIVSLCKNEKRRILAWTGFLANLIALVAGFVT